MLLSKIIFVIAASFLFSAQMLWARDVKMDSVGMEKVDGKYFLLHRVEKNEDIYFIAKKYNITAKELSANNPNINTENLRPGTILKVIYKKHIPQMKAYRVKSGESLLGICKRMGVTLEQVQKLNGFYHSKIKAGQQLLIGFDVKHAEAYTVAYDLTKQWELSYHTVQAGETLFRIAKDFNIKTDSLILWNNIENNQIKVGQLLLTGRKLSGTESKAQNSTAEYTEVVDEKGTGEIMYIGSNQLYALHKDAPVGTQITVYNESLGRSVRVKVIGEIPNNEANKKYILKLSEAACEELGFINREFPIRIVFRRAK